VASWEMWYSVRTLRGSCRDIRGEPAGAHDGGGRVYLLHERRVGPIGTVWKYAISIVASEETTVFLAYRASVSLARNCAAASGVDREPGRLIGGMARRPFSFPKRRD